MRIEVDPQQLVDAGKQVGSLGTQLNALSDAMSQVLSGGIASGSDPAGLSFGIGYGRQADEFAKALADAANAFKNVGVMLEATGFNYRNADAASTPGGPGPSGGVGGEPAQTTAGDAPYGPNGSMVPPPGKWWLITPFLRMIPGFGIVAGAAMTWPSGNAAMMNLTAAQWRNIGQGLSVFESALAGAKGLVDAQDVPEKASIKEALNQIGTGASDLSKFATGLATAISEFATGVQETQDAIRDLLNRISLDGLWDTVTGLFSGDGDRVLREIADDVSTVLENFQNQVKGVIGLLEELKTLIGEAGDAFQKWIRPVLVEAFGDGVGNRVADAISFYNDVQIGAASGLINLVSGTVALADADTWKGLADTAKMLIDDPSKTDDVLKAIGSEFIALEQWQGDNPGRGLGEAGFNIATLLVPGGALAKGGSVVKGLSATRHLLDNANSGSLGRLSGIGGNRTPDMPRLPDTPGAPEIRDFEAPQGIPDSVLTPGGSDTPTRPQNVGPGAGSPTPGNGGGNAPAGPAGDGASGGGSSNGGPAPAGSTPSGGGSSPDGGGPTSPGNSTPSPSISPSTDAPGSGGMNDQGSEGRQSPSDSASTHGGSNSGGSDGPGEPNSGMPQTPDDRVPPSPNLDPTDNGSSGSRDDGRTYTLSDGTSHQTSFAPEQLGDNQRVSDALSNHGVSRSDFIELVQRPIDSLTPDERNLINAVRNDLSAPGPDTVMQKVIPPGSYAPDGAFKPGGADSYLDGTYDAGSMRGAVTVADDTSHLGTPSGIHDGLRLDYDGTAFTPNDANAHVIRFQTDPGSSGSYDVPRHSSMGGSGNYDGWTDPFTGNGFTKSGDDIVPEYGANDVTMREGAEMWEILDDGNQRLVAVLKDSQWVRQGGADG